MKLDENLTEKILAHAKKEFPRECCGLVVVVKGRLRYFPCTNIAETPDEHFVIDSADFINAESKGEICAVAHSHPCSNHAPSAADRVACERSGIPWLVVKPQTEKWGDCEPEGFQLPYVGREFSHGIVDCYTLWKDFYKKEFGIEMSEYDRRDDWWHKGQNLYVDNFEKEGMREVPQEDLQYGDIVLMQLDSPVPNHCAIYIGDQQILHHVQGRLSSRDVYGDSSSGFYVKATAKVLRHKSR